MRAATINRSGLHAAAIAAESPQGIVVRPLHSGVEHEVRRVFRDRFVADRLRAIGDHDMRAYESMCLEWYLTGGRAQSRAIIADGQVRGCALVCLDGAAYDRWGQKVAAQWLSTTMARYITGSAPDASRQFVRHRLSDGLRRRRGRLPAVLSAHARLHLDGAIDDVVPCLVREVDEIVRAAALPGWDAELNLPAGQSVNAFPRDHDLVVHRLRSETLSWPHGRPVDRVRIARRLSQDTRPESTRRNSNRCSWPAHASSVASRVAPDRPDVATGLGRRPSSWRPSRYGAAGRGLVHCRSRTVAKGRHADASRRRGPAVPSRERRAKNS